MTTPNLNNPKVLKLLIKSAINGLSAEHLTLVYCFITGIYEGTNKQYEDEAIAALIDAMPNEMGTENLQ